MNVLNKGTSFVPTYHSNLAETEISFYRFMRSIRLKHFFTNVIIEQEPPASKEYVEFKPKSTFVAPVSHKTLDLFEKLVLLDIHKLDFKVKKNSNFSKKERNILQKLSNQKELTFQRADKGGALIIMNTEHYNKKVMEHLADETTYLRLEIDPTQEIMLTLGKILTHAKEMDWITTKTEQFLTKQNPKRPHLYMLPKVHKNLYDPPLRPIVSGVGSLFEPLGTYIDFFLQKFVSNWKTTIKDTTDFFKSAE